MHASVITHEHSSFQRMILIPAHMADDHLLHSVREGMRSALFQHGISSSGGGSKADSSGGGDKAPISKYFDIPTVLPSQQLFHSGDSPTTPPVQ